MMSGNIQGSNYVQNPNTEREIYNTVEGRTVRNDDITIPSSGTTPAKGATFLWTANLETKEGGFTGKSWLLDNYKDVNPLVIIGKLYSDDQVIDYLKIHRNFNEIFSQWDPSEDEWYKFFGAFISTGTASGCAQMG